MENKLISNAKKALAELSMWATNGYYACNPEKADKLVSIIDNCLDLYNEALSYDNINNADSKD